jgi:ribosomal protein S12 methylthiotransferase
MPDQLDEELKIHRAEIVMETQAEIAAELANTYVGKTVEVLVEGFDRVAESWYGRGAMDAPDIDTKVFFTSTMQVKPGDFIPVLIEDTMDCDLIGITDEGEG